MTHSRLTQSVTVFVTTSLIISAQFVVPQSFGYIPEPGQEAACLGFVLNLYNQLSNRTMRSAPLRVDYVKMENLRYAIQHPTEIWYRFFGTTLVDTKCPNTAIFSGASLARCPIPESSTITGVSWSQTCDFKVWYAPSMRPDLRFQMMYMDCYM